MDPLTHSLVGAGLAESGLGRRTRFATAALLIGANLPDVDILSYFWGADVALGFRRGWTHGILLIAIQPFLLSGLLVMLDRLRPRSDSQARFATLSWLSAIAVASHPVLDWLNTYGVRFLMPFDGRWFYGDGLFVIDPYGWLMLGGALFLARPVARLWERVIWGILAGLTSLVLFGFPSSPPAARWVWVAGLVVLGGLRLAPLERYRSRMAAAGLALMLTYIVSMVTMSGIIAQSFERDLESSGAEDIRDVMASPVPADPFSWDVVARTSAGYRFGTWHLREDERPILSPQVIETPPDEPWVEEALAVPYVRGAVTWMRYPYFEIDPLDATKIWLVDARYNRLRRRGFGSALIHLDTEIEEKQD